MTVAIVGAGAAGAAIAYSLREAGADVTVFEKSRGVCGRAATRRREGCRYDYGANYVKDDDERVTRLLTEELDTDGLVEIEDPVWTFDGEGAISEGRDGDERKRTYEAGITQIAKRLFARTDATVHRETRVGAVSREDGDWSLADTEDTDLGTFDTLVLTPPAPQTAELLATTRWDDGRRVTLHDAVAAVDYASVFTAVCHYPFTLDRPWYALVNTDRNHQVGWLSREELKPGHVPDGESLLVAQMGHDWSGERIDDDPQDVLRQSVGHVTELLGDDRVADPDWTDTQGWRYALPNDGLSGNAHRECEAAGLYVAGDWVVGEARVHAALRNGLDVGERIAERH
ncbi:NAD(P)/FAD-dependent oxidoreductase [Halomarina oriensis]|uniref:FAD-dependent oxidoreductase n=1 Tax=Halomarina oriensis TaxID=671145 RepID=A0A6B0GW06_9EURY|nr:FAD-dependent oxidoreductase [Halomarina oriensis]MWG36763.1 FAD-dependent oxidoreductase [Halomarina oriensis]